MSANCVSLNFILLDLLMKRRKVDRKLGGSWVYVVEMKGSASFQL